MTKTSVKKAAARSATKTYKVVATLKDGVKILAPKSKPTHFTTKEIRETIQKVLKKSSARG